MKGNLMAHKKHKAPKNSHKRTKNLEKPPPLPVRSELPKPGEIPESVLNMSENTAGTQETALDMYARGAAAAIDSLRNLFPLIPSSLFDLAQTNTVDFIRMQMRLLDLMTNQGKTYIREIDETVRRA